MTTEDSIELELEIQATDTDANELNKMARNLREEVYQSTKVESISLLKIGPAPDGSKAGEAEAIGTLAVQVLPAVLPGLFSLVQDWVARGRGRTIKFKYDGMEFEGSREDLEKILEKIERGKKKK